MFPYKTKFTVSFNLALEKRQTGLFCFRGKAGSPFAVIAPGGGFAYVGSVHEGFPFAAKIAEHGYHAFVLRYRLGNREIGFGRVF